MYDWLEAPAEEFCESVRDGTHDSPKPVEDGRYLITSRHIIGDRVDLTNAYRISQVDFDEVNRRSKVDRWDVLITMIGTVGDVCLVREEPNFAIKNIGLFKTKGEKNGKWLYYYMKSPFSKALIESQKRGTTQAYIPLGDLRRFPIKFPKDESLAGAITSLLSSLDDKIELNRRMNETLESMARAIFKDWFVDFGPTRAKAAGRPSYLAPELWDLFPDGLDEEDQPFGWRKDTLGALFNVSIGRTPPRKEQQHFVPRGSGRTWLSIRTMGNIQTFAAASAEDLTAHAVKQFRVPLIPAGTVLVSFKLTVGRVAIAAKDMHSNEAIAHLVANHETPVANLFTYCFMKDFDYDSLSSTSSIATAVNSKSIKAIEMIVPDSAAHSAFVAIVKPLFDRILCNLRESDALSATRDFLIPKLMSGKIRLSEVEEAVA